MDYSMYVGPYAQCKVGTTTEEEPFLGCTNTKCINATRDLPTKFCPDCGAPRGERIRMLTVDVVDDYDVGELLHNLLRTPSGDGYLAWSQQHHMHLWIINGSSRLERDPALDLSAAFMLDTISAEIVAREMLAFADLYSLQLQKLRKVYGADAVSLHWGIVQDYS